MNLRELKDKIRNLIALDNLEKVFEILGIYLSRKDEALYSHLILLKSQYSNLKFNVSIGIIERIEGTTISKIRFSILQLLENITDDISSGGVQDTIYLTNRPYVDMENVIGRESDIDTLANVIKTAHKTVLLNGWGGIGKTTVAKGYLNKYEHNYQYVIWVEVTNELVIDFLNQVDFDKLGFSSNDALTPSQNFKRLIEKLDQLESEKLIIIDNVNRVEDVTSSLNYFPKYCKVLITSRVRIPHFVEYKLGNLSVFNARRLFYSFYKKEIDDENLMKLLEMVGFHTLTIELIARTAEEVVDLDIKKVLNIFRNKKLTAKEREINKSVLSNNPARIEFE